MAAMQRGGGERMAAARLLPLREWRGRWGLAEIRRWGERPRRGFSCFASGGDGGEIEIRRGGGRMAVAAGRRANSRGDAIRSPAGPVGIVF